MLHVTVQVNFFYDVILIMKKPISLCEASYVASAVFHFRSYNRMSMSCSDRYADQVFISAARYIVHPTEKLVLLTSAEVHSLRLRV